MPMTSPSPSEPARMPAGVKLAIDFGPLVVFFAAYRTTDIFIATLACMVATAIAIAVAWFMARRLPVMLIVTGVIVMVFGGLTVTLHDSTFFKMKPTIIYGLFGAVLLGGLVFGKPLLAHALEFAFKLDDAGWRRLTLRWALFFLAMAVLNEAVWRNFDESTWVNVKIFGFTAITFAFAMAQVPFMSRHTVAEESEASQG